MWRQCWNGEVWCPGSLRRQVISSHGTDYTAYTGLQPPGQPHRWEIIENVNMNLYCSEKFSMLWVKEGWWTTYLSLTRRICVWKWWMFSKLCVSVTEYTRRNPSPFRIYCSRIALNSSWPAVSSTETGKNMRPCGTQAVYFLTIIVLNLS